MEATLDKLISGHLAAGTQLADTQPPEVHVADTQPAEVPDASMAGEPAGGESVEMAELDNAELDGAELDDADLDGEELDDAELGGEELDDAEQGVAELGTAEQGTKPCGVEPAVAHLHGAEHGVQSELASRSTANASPCVPSPPAASPVSDRAKARRPGPKNLSCVGLCPNVGFVVACLGSAVVFWAEALALAMACRDMLEGRMSPEEFMQHSAKTLKDGDLAASLASPPRAPMVTSPGMAAVAAPGPASLASPAAPAAQPRQAPASLAPQSRKVLPVAPTPQGCVPVSTAAALQELPPKAKSPGLPVAAAARSPMLARPSVPLLAPPPSNGAQPTSVQPHVSVASAPGPVAPSATGALSPATSAQRPLAPAAALGRPVPPGASASGASASGSPTSSSASPAAPPTMVSPTLASSPSVASPSPSDASNPLNILTLPSHDPAYKRAYACFKRSVANPRTASAIKEAFTGNARTLFAEWLGDNRSFDGAILRLKQYRKTESELADECGYRTAWFKMGGGLAQVGFLTCAAAFVCDEGCANAPTMHA